MEFVQVQFRVRPSMRDHVRFPEDASLFEWEEFCIARSRRTAELEAGRRNKHAVWLEYRAEPPKQLR